MYVCYNQEEPDVDCELINQNEHWDSLPFKPTGCGWKFYPPRLDIEAHEIFIDNDMILYDTNKVLNYFLSHNNVFFATEPWKRTYGKYDGLVPRNFNINAGFIGLPPGFDIASEIRQKGGGWDGWFDEQGLVALILSSKQTLIHPKEEIKICVPENGFGLAKCGMHFVGMNSGYNLEIWNNFLASKLL